LSAEERHISWVSWPNLSKTQAEFEYLKQRKKMREMKADGRIQNAG